MMDELPPLAQLENKRTFLIRIIEFVVCAVCLIIFIVLVCLCSLKIFITASILTVAALTTCILVVSIIRLRKKKKPFRIVWLFIALASIIGYSVCVAFFFIQGTVLYQAILYLSLAMAILAAHVFLFDFIYNLRNIIIDRKKQTRLNQIMPVSSVVVKKLEESLVPITQATVSHMEGSQIGEQLPYNPEMCRMQWNQDKTSSTPTVKIIYVQPCNSSVSNNICPAFRKCTCERCLQNEEHEVNITKPAKESRNEFKSTQFPEDNESICPLCSFKRAKMFKSTFAQTSDEYHVLPNTVLKPKQENTIKRHSAKSFKTPPLLLNKFTQSYPATPRKSDRQIKSKRNSPKLLIVNETTQVSAEDFEETPVYIKASEDKVTQVSLNDFIEEQRCCTCSKIERREIETQVLLDDFTETGRCNTENNCYGDQYIIGNESTQVSFRDFQPDERRSSTKNKLTQVTSSNCYLQEEILVSKFNEDKLTHLCSRDFVQKERKSCGVPDCQHPRCFKYDKTNNNNCKEMEETVQVNPVKQTFDGVVQTESVPLKVFVYPKTDTQTNTIDDQTKTDTFKETSCQTTRRLENTHPKPNERKQTPQEQNLPKECVKPICTCIINEKEISTCAYCKLIRDNYSMPKSEGKSTGRTSRSSGIPLKSGCKCNLQKCICCKIEELKELRPSPKKEDECYCIKTERGLLRCAFCETAIQQKKDRQQGGMDNPMCSTSVTTCFLYQGSVPESVQNSNQVENANHSTQTGNTDGQKKTVTSYKKSSEDEVQNNKVSTETFEKNENEVNEDNYYTSSTCTSESPSNDSETRVCNNNNNYLTKMRHDTKYKKEREDMLYYLANKETERTTLCTLQKKIDVLEIESTEDSEAEKTENDLDEDEEHYKKMISVWDGLAGKHAAYQDRIRKQFESNIKFGDDTKLLHDGPIEMVENTQPEMQNIYNCMIKNLLERQNQKENNLIFLEKLNCGCNSDAESSKHHTDGSARMEEEICKGRTHFKETPFFQCSFQKFDIETAKEENCNNAGDDAFLSTISEEINDTPSDLTSTLKESNEELLENHEEEVDPLNATYCLKIAHPLDCSPEVLHKNLKINPNDTVFVPLIPCNLQRDKKDAEKIPKKTIYSATCKNNVSPKSCSARSEKGARKSAGYFEPFMFSQTFGSTKTSFTTSDNESTVDSTHQDNVKTLWSATGSSVSFSLQEDLNCSPVAVVEVVQSKSVPMTSRKSGPLNEETGKTYFCGHSIPCTPKKICWLETDTDILETTTLISNKESGYHEDIVEAPSMIAIDNCNLETCGNRENAKIVPPLPIANITPEQSESEDSRPISCSSHTSVETLQYLECRHLEEAKQSKKSPVGMKSEPQSTRPHPIVEKSISPKHEVEPTIMRERHISAPPKSSQRNKSSSPKLTKIISATARSFRQKPTSLDFYKSSEKMKGSIKPSARKSQYEQLVMKHVHVCHCEFYKNSRYNYCRMHGMGTNTHTKINSAPTNNNNNNLNPESSKTSPPVIPSAIGSPKSPRKIPKPKTLEGGKASILERPKSWVEQSKSLQENPKKLTKSGETSPKLKSKLKSMPMPMSKPKLKPRPKLNDIDT